jgi:hypothetical protein
LQQDIQNLEIAKFTTLHNYNQSELLRRSKLLTNVYFPKYPKIETLIIFHYKYNFHKLNSIFGHLSKKHFKMDSFKVLSFLLFLNAIYCAQLSYRDCGPSDRSIKYNAVKIDPYPILYPGIQLNK